MSKVKTESVLRHKRTGLLNMLAENHSESLVKKMGRTVVSCGQCTVFLIDLKGNCLTILKHSLCHYTDMADLSALKLNCILNLKLSVFRYDHTDICLLSAHGSIERCFLHEDRSLLSVGKGFHDLICRCQDNDLRFMA